MNKKKLLERINPLYLNGIAHRGLHDDKLCENGIPAFKEAIKNNVAFEFDIHLTKDNELVVCHDSELKRVTGKEGIIEDLTLKEIKDNYVLLDGTKIPTFEELLTLNNEQVPIVIELKVYRKNYKELGHKTVEVLKKFVKDKRNYMLISFDPRSLWASRKSGLINSLLVCIDHKWTYHLRHTCDSLDLEYQMSKEPRVIRYRKRHFVNVWTINTVDKFNEYKDYVDTTTFELIDYKFVNDGLNNK